MNQEITLIKDIEYLGPERAEKMDAYLPAPSFPGPHPAILLIHGGGWRINDKANAREISIGTDLASSGYAVFSINYLLNEAEEDENGQMQLTKVAWPQNFYDCKSALRFLRAQAHKYNLDPDRIATMGGSAGGHLAMLVGTTAHHRAFNQQGLYTEQANTVSCMLSLYGEFDLRARPETPVRGKTPEESARNAHDASPISWIDHCTPPVFITHGTADTIIPVQRSRLLAQHLQEMGLEYWYVEISGAGHSYDLHPAQMNLEPTVLSFLAKHLGQPHRS
ncbi:alpha/beta hydrolase [Kiritimatiellota bacterium B12222]|nr:alpha/beta hydrolase [Kiritimatiellota bacterium B12222]